MSIVFENDTGAFISMERYINAVIQMDKPCQINSDLFQICSPYTLKTSIISKKKKRQTAESSVQDQAPFDDLEQEATSIRNKYLKILPILRNQGVLQSPVMQHEKNAIALKAADFIYKDSGEHLIKNAVGSNFGPATIKTIQNSKYIFPENSQFFCKDVKEIDNTPLMQQQFDLILLDPPWWNKYIRRKRKKCPHAYEMMYNCDLKRIPIELLLGDDGIVVVWCTNSPQHLKYLDEEIFPKWKIKFVAKWYWLKVTLHGETICQFSKPPGKQPFEQIIIGYRDDKISKNLPPNNKLLISVPSAIHSHKPPLVEVLQPFLPSNPKCLELFARYLLPNWTSYGNEVLRLQHESLYTIK